MRFHIRAITQRKCKCGKNAKVTIFNSYNSPCGDYCTCCGKIELANRNTEEMRNENRDKLIKEVFPNYRPREE
jgi:hypothetical protein